MPKFEMSSSNSPVESMKKESTPKIEHVHNEKEVLALFEEIIGGEKYETRRKLEDEKGLYLWEIKIAEADGGTAEYLYIRKGDYKARGLAGGSASETAIHAVYLDAEGDFISGTSVKKFLDGKWKDTP